MRPTSRWVVGLTIGSTLVGCQLNWDDETSDAGAAGGCVVGLVPPAAATSCTSEGLACEYGSDPRPLCRTVVTCGGGQWALSQDAAACGALPSSGCPASPNSSVSCPGSLLICEYPENDPATECGCCGQNSCTWTCTDPLAAGCPPNAPDFGQPCSTESLACAYGLASLGTAMTRTCAGGIWTKS